MTSRKHVLYILASKNQTLVFRRRWEFRCHVPKGCLVETHMQSPNLRISAVKRSWWWFKEADLKARGAAFCMSSSKKATPSLQLLNHWLSVLSTRGMKMTQETDLEVLVGDGMTRKRGSAGTRLSLLSIASCGFWESVTNCLEYLYEWNFLSLYPGQWYCSSINCLSVSWWRLHQTA